MFAKKLFFLVVDCMSQVFFAKNIDNVLMELAVKFVHLYFIKFYITTLYSMFNSNKLMTTYLYWSLTKFIYFIRYLCLIDIISVNKSISYDLFVIRVMVSNQQILPSFFSRSEGQNGATPKNFKFYFESDFDLVCSLDSFMKFPALIS